MSRTLAAKAAIMAERGVPAAMSQLATSNELLIKISQPAEAGLAMKDTGGLSSAIGHGLICSRMGNHGFSSWLQCVLLKGIHGSACPERKLAEISATLNRRLKKRSETGKNCLKLGILQQIIGENMDTRSTFADFFYSAELEENKHNYLCCRLLLSESGASIQFTISDLMMLFNYIVFTRKLLNLLEHVLLLAL
jgi:hypothetical protein